MEILNLTCKKCNQHWITTGTIDESTCPKCFEKEKIEGWVMGDKDMTKLYHQDEKKARKGGVHDQV